MSTAHFISRHQTLKRILPTSLYKLLGQLYYFVRVVYFEHSGLGRRLDAVRLRAAIKKQEAVLIQLGAGFKERSGWVNTDYCPRKFSLYHLNALRPFPLPTSSVDAYYTEHQVEHLPLETTLRLFSELYRTLKPGGGLRVSVPSLTNEIKRYQQNLYQEYDYTSILGELFPHEEPFVLTPAVAFNSCFRAFGHCFVYDEETLSTILKQAGFETVKAYEFKQSTNPYFEGLDCRHSSLILEAYKSVDS